MQIIALIFVNLYSNITLSFSLINKIEDCLLFIIYIRLPFQIFHLFPNLLLIIPCFKLIENLKFIVTDQIFSKKLFSIINHVF